MVCQHSSYDAFTILAPNRSMAWSLLAGADSKTSTAHDVPTRLAASATPCAAFPALTVQTPPARSAGVSRRTALYAPRILKDPTGWNVSSLRYRLVEPSKSTCTSGVRTTGSYIAPAASRILSRRIDRMTG